MAGGYMGKICFIDLSTGDIREESLREKTSRDFIGGYGLGARMLYEHQPGGVDPLGPDNMLGFLTGPLTGTRTPTGGRYMVVCKSPLTGCWGDANSGGYFGSALKSAGLDAVFLKGISPSPQYLLITETGIELKDASHLWGKDTVETEAILQAEVGVKKMRTACIGPASEKLSLISGISCDKGRFAARAGIGAVMGSKRLKAISVYGNHRVPVADEARLAALRKEFVQEINASEAFPKVLKEYGTCGLTDSLVTQGATPIKNWSFAGKQAFPTVEKISNPQHILQYQTKKYACANCPIGCGGMVSTPSGPYGVEETHKPEYETIAAFGTMCLNDDILTIIKLTDMCNRSGLDTISAGSVLAFAMECYEKGILTLSDTDGIEMTWGNKDAMITMLDKIIQRQGVGDLLADGVKSAAEKIGKGADTCAVHVSGQEPGLHNATFLPGRGTGYVCDPTPGRHTAAVMARLDAGSAGVAPYPELQFHDFKQYEYKSKGPASAVISCFYQIASCAGVCLFPSIFFGNYRLIDYLNAVTGWEMDMDEALKTGARIQTLRQCFNLREGKTPSHFKLPRRMAEMPLENQGPLAGVEIDIDSLSREYRKAMEIDPETGRPTDHALERLGLKGFI